ncbi:three-prime repair exonuclease 1-like [Glandiceps talaboti]
MSQRSVKSKTRAQTSTDDIAEPLTIPIQTFVFLDTEATGLPSRNGKKLPDVTELAMIAVPRKSLTKASVDDEVPRVSDKIVFCISPNKQVVPRAEEMTGLSKASLEKYGKQRTNKLLVLSLKCFLLRQAQPICLVAHAGDRFDFKVLKRELSKVRVDVDSLDLDIPNLYTADSLLFYQRYLPDESRTLADLADTYLDEDVSHGAEGDASSLMKLVALSDFTSKFLNWVELNKTEYEI